MNSRFVKSFENSFKDNWDLLAMSNYETKQSYAYKDVVREIINLHTIFSALNISQNDKIAVIGNNTPEWAITFLATITYGAVIVPILKDFQADDIVNVLEHSEAKLLFVDDIQWNRIENKNFSGLRAVFALEDFSCLKQASAENLHIIMKNIPSLIKETYADGISKENFRFPLKDDHELCILNYTSGTTGDSKAVMLSGNNFSCLINFGKSYKIGDKNKKFLSYIPLAHVFGYGDGILFPMVSGSNVVFLPHMPQSNEFIGVIQDISPNYISMVPMVLNAICKKEVVPFLKQIKDDEFQCKALREKMINIFGGRVDKMVVGGASMDAEVEEALAAIKFPYLIAYGMTECASLLFQESDNRGDGSVGKVIDGVEILIDSDDPYNIPGEILVRGANVMMGYFKNEIATKNVIKDGWYHTGDLGLFDKDECLHLKGRCKALILTSSGQNVYPERMEEILNNIEGVCDSLVIQRNEKIVALVRIDLRVMKTLAVNNIEDYLEQQRSLVNKRLASYEYISDFIVQENDFERTSKGTIKRHLYM